MALGLGPISSSPISALRDNSLGLTIIECDSSVEARMSNPLKDIVGDPRIMLVIAAEINPVPFG